MTSEPGVPQTIHPGTAGCRMLSCAAVAGSVHAKVGIPMSIARRVTVRRLLGTGAASLTLCAASVAAASGAFAATGTPGGDGWKSGGGYQPGHGRGHQDGDRPLPVLARRHQLLRLGQGRRPDT